MNWLPEIIRCPSCRGTGRMKEPQGPGEAESLPCPHCNGTGYIKRKDKDRPLA